MSSKKIPITAITGFLGSGKTTLLNHILTHNEGLRIGVVVNDYGDINIDSQLVADQTDKTLELTNGCICCSLGTLELDEAIGQFTHPGSKIDYIIIEASGLAEPADLAATLREASGRLTKLDSIVAVLDAAHLEAKAQGHATAIEQVQYSDFVLINKTDLVPQKKIDEIVQLIQAINPRVRYFTTVRSKIDVRLLLDKDVHQPSEHQHSHEHHLHEDYQTVSFATDQPLDPIKFQEFVNQQIPTSIYRAKGIVNLGNKGRRRKYIFQLVGKRAELTWADWNEEVPRTELVFIGRDFDEQQLLARAEACIDPSPNEHLDSGQEIVLPRREL